MLSIRQSFKVTTNGIWLKNLKRQVELDDLKIWANTPHWTEELSFEVDNHLIRQKKGQPFIQCPECSGTGEKNKTACLVCMGFGRRKAEESNLKRKEGI